MRKIPLTQGKVALVDDADHEWLNQWKWTYGRSGYAVRGEYNGGNYKTIRMHRVIVSTPFGKFTDHINGDKLNNQRSNLRICDKAQNGYNREKPLTNSSGYKGVQLHNKNKQLAKPWKACMRVRGKYYHLGFFETPEEAAKAWNKAALKQHGEFARLNLV